MDRIVTILVGLILVVKSQDLDRCLDTAIFNRHCCNYEISEENKAILRECFQEAHDLNSCDFDICYGEKRGFIMSNGTVNKTLLEGVIEKDFENYTGVFDVVKEKCLSDDSNVYVLEDTCRLREFSNCLRFYTLLKCPNWIESDQCTKVKNIIQDCEKNI